MGALGKDRGLRKMAAGSAAVGDDLRRLNGSSRRSSGAGESGRGGMTGDLFAWGARQKRYRSTGSLSVRHGARTQGVYGIERSAGSFRRDRKLGSYLYSGSFGTPSPVAREGHDVQRNRVVFLVVVALLVGFVVFRLMAD